MEDSSSYQSKSEIVSVRLTPKLRFALELHSRLRHRSMGQTIELALERLLDDTSEGSFVVGQDGQLRNVFKDVWSVFPFVRLIRLAIQYPDLLTEEEEVIWEVVQSDHRLVTWASGAFPAERVEARFDIDAVERYWDEVVASASRRLGRTVGSDGKTVRPPRKQAGGK